MKAKELFKNLKKELDNFSIYDIMMIRSFIEKDAKYLPPQYKNHYVEAMMKYLIETFNEIKKKKVDEIEDEEIDEKKLNKMLNRIENFRKYYSSDEEGFINLSKILCPYLAFIAKKPLHPEYLTFPGNVKIIKKGNDYYCPVKNKQLNEYSLCEFCVAKSMDELKKLSREKDDKGDF
ncbi:DUF2115 domain-containing protein [Methanocaldococcus fervens]|uniref:UPF0305 protein Mefer_0261 n=1 Tax=Methanocaldococcus fervens (strain DSM 4213 / JCM 15782 / AG86) TaxID=573064 RepID=C7P6B7_METFA|nr:DUF2115 domain-containing protein [Methanocaldococcus fervens]ACV24099.1 Protein of unknown function DUF2115 [Methanocaldococcus fervens AG86]